MQWSTGSLLLPLYPGPFSFGQVSRTLSAERRAPEQQARVDTDLNSAPRHALVIGNSRYSSVSPLRNPANDASAMAEQLIDDAAAMFARAVLSDEGQEGTGAFMQKRKPYWVL